MPCSAAFSLDGFQGPEVPEETEQSIAALSSAQKQHMVNICEPGWPDVGNQSEMGLLSFYGKNLPKNPLVESRARFLEMSCTLWCKK